MLIEHWSRTNLNPLLAQFPFHSRWHSAVMDIVMVVSIKSIAVVLIAAAGGGAVTVVADLDVV